jgi:hypothetical protein
MGEIDNSIHNRSTMHCVQLLTYRFESYTSLLRSEGWHGVQNLREASDPMHDVSMTTKEYIVSHSSAASHTNSEVMRERLSRSHKCIVSGELMVETEFKVSYQ